MTATRTSTDAALEWAHDGYHVHRLKSRQKAPGTAHGHHDATTDPATIARMFSPDAQSNIGVALHPTGVFVIAPDCEERLAEFEALGLPETMIVQSGSGPGHVHYWYRRPDECEIYRLCRSGDFDLMTNGYAVVPPSVTTGGYTFLTPFRPVSALPIAPAWAVEMLNAAKTAEDAKPAPAPLPARPLSLSDQEIVDKMLSARNGAQTQRLMFGDLDAHNGHDHSWSGGVLALLSRITFYTQDELQVERIFEHCGLYRPEKWRGSFRTSTLRKALQRTEFYDPTPRPSPSIAILQTTTSAVSAPSQPTNQVTDSDEFVTSTDEERCVVERMRIAELEQRITQLEAENQQFKSLYQETGDVLRALTDAFENPAATPAETWHMVRLAMERAAKYSTGNHDNGRVLVRLGNIAKVNRSLTDDGEVIEKPATGTASRHVKRYEEAGFIRCDRVPGRTDDGAPITDLYIEPPDTGAPEPQQANAWLVGELRRMAAFSFERPNRGGRHPARPHCPEHPDADIEVTRVTRCVECKTPISETIIATIPAAPFQNETGSHSSNVDDSLVAQNETGRKMERRRALQRTRPSQNGTVPISYAERDAKIMTIVETASRERQPLTEVQIALKAGCQPRDVRESLRVLTQRGELKQWGDGVLTMSSAPAPIGAD